MFDLPNVDNNIFYIGENETAWVWGWDGGWAIFGVYDIEGVEDEKLTPFLAISFIWLKHQREGIIVEMPEPSSKEEKVWDSDDFDNN